MRTPRFEIFEGKNNEFFFRLKAKNGKIIFNSKGEGYTQKHNAKKCIEVVRAGNYTWGIFKAQNGEWYFTFRGLNDERIGSSETYKRFASAEKGIESCRRCAPIAEIVDLSKD